jgi:hypothetical protein
MPNFNGSIYFYCVPSSPELGWAFHHPIICLAEGLRDLGIKIYANCNYWQLSSKSDEYLIYHDPQVNPEDCSVVVIDQDWFIYGQPFPQHLFYSSRKNTIIYLDQSDGTKPHSWKPEFRQFDFIFKTHINKYFYYPSNIYPWAFGLSNRNLEAVKVQVSFQERKSQILINFRDKNNVRHSTHSVRKSFYKKVLPLIEKILAVDRKIDSFDPSPGSDEHLMWQQTCYRHRQEYYERLQRSVACACFGGYFESPFIKDKSFYASRLQRRILYELGIETYRVSQWDSWRFWESLAAGCATFHLDFEKYGLALPVMPENQRHYIGVDLNNVQATIDKIADEPRILERIGAEGRHWALKNYSPKPTALRFLKKVCNLDIIN